MKTTILFICCFCATTLWAQQVFISGGKLVFEKKIDLSKELGGQLRYRSVIDKMPKYHTSQHILYFSGTQTRYEKGEDIAEKNPYYTDDRNDDDIIYTDLRKKQFVKKQAVFEETVLVADSIRKIQWEMTNDTRLIAGFECHKATAIILDSIFVIAFYCDQILTNGGPLSFCNLPGMILGIAIPRLNLTIFATKLELSLPAPAKLFSPQQKPSYDYKMFTKYVSEIGKRRFPDDEGKRYAIKSLF